MDMLRLVYLFMNHLKVKILLKQVVKMPEKTEKLLGGHAVAVVGYDDNYGFLVRNSWGVDWGVEGYCFHTL